MAEHELHPELRHFLLSQAARPSNEKADAQYRMAEAIIAAFLGYEFYTKRVSSSDTPDAFLLNGKENSQDKRFLHQFRVCSLADYLFDLRNMTGIDVIRERLATRDVRPSYYEAKVAADMS